MGAHALSGAVIDPRPLDELTPACVQRRSTPLPAIGFVLVAASGDIYRGLWYPIAACLATVVVGTLFLPETRGRPDIVPS